MLMKKKEKESKKICFQKEVNTKLKLNLEEKKESKKGVTSSV